jgi:diacylglycerol kinase family enzyme
MWPFDRLRGWLIFVPLLSLLSLFLLPMYFYIIDPQRLNQKTFERVQNQLYSCLSENRISGEISRITTLRSMAQLVDTALSRGAKTLVTIGTDETLQDMINAVKGRDITLGYIPIEETEMSKILGLTGIETAAKAIASRRIEMLDLGTVNHNWFLTRLTFGGGDETESSSGSGLLNIFKKIELPSMEIKFFADEKYYGVFRAAVGTIINARDNSGGGKGLANPTDSVLDLLMVPGGSNLTRSHKKDLANGTLENIAGCSVVHLKKIELTGPPGMPLKAAGKVIAKVPATIEVIPKALKMIVGRDRTF